MMLSFLLAQSESEGVKYLYFLLAWLLGAAISGYLSERKGYGDKPGLVTGLVISILGVIVWLVIPPRPNSDWKIKGPIGNKRKDSPA